MDRSLAEIKALSKSHSEERRAFAERQHVRRSARRNIMNYRIPEINVPILKPTTHVLSKPKSLKELAKKVTKPIQNSLNKFADWIISYVPEPIRKTANDRVEKLKKKVNDIFERYKNRNPIERESALQGTLTTHRIEGHDAEDPKIFLRDSRPGVIDLINRQNKPIKLNLILVCTFYKFNKETLKRDFITVNLRTKVQVVFDSTNISILFNELEEYLHNRIEKFQNAGSGWIFEKVEFLDIEIDPFEPLSGSSYIKLPKEIEAKKAIINVKNENDHECFKWAVTSAVFPVDENPQRLTKKMREDSEKFNWTGMKFPLQMKDIDEFERKNPYRISVFGLTNFDGVYPLRTSKKREGEVIDLLFLKNEKTSHYCWIKNLSRLLSAQVNDHKGKRFICRRCLNHFNTEESLMKHQEYCDNNEEMTVEMPKDKDGKPEFLTFKNYNRKMTVPFVIYADFECFTEKIEGCKPNSEKCFTNKYQKHKPSGFCYYAKFSDDRIFKGEPVTYTAKTPDEDVEQIFVDSLEWYITHLYKQMKKKKLCKMTTNEVITFTNATKCHICDEELGLDKVLDHCHLTGDYRGAAHNKCNLQYQIPKFVPVFFHNLSGYDSHLFVKNLGKSEGNIKCIPYNEENYISFTKQVVVDSFKDKKTDKDVQIKRELRFVDSQKFMAAALAKLVGNITNSGKCDDNLIETKKFFRKYIQLVMRKGVFPYDWFDSFEKLNETQLPPKEEFYSTLYDTNISDEDYKHAQQVWDTLNMKTMREYHDFYMKLDVLLLADVFENFRKVCSKNYNLDPAWYYTAPGLAWDACLKLTKVKLELLTDYDMLLMIEKGTRGGVSMISTRHGEANNPYMSNFDPDKPTKYITYLDANSLYPTAMSMPLPTHGFRWMNDEELKGWEGLPCILEVDLTYPTQLHDLHNDYPLAPERVKTGLVEKLIPNLYNKTKYVLHYRNLKQYLKMGLKLTKIHRGITFEESIWMKPYIDLNTEFRTKANNDFEKDFFKLMSNSVFGKTMENIRKRVDVRLVTNEKDARKLISKPNYVSRTIFCENLVAIHMKRVKLKFDKPVYLGMCILDLSKTVMYNFHYDYIKPKYGDKAKLLFTDTDSLCYELETDDFYKDITPDVRERFDTSNYPKDHPSGIETGVNKKVIGMFKDEAAGKQITEFVGLRAKLYAYKIDEGNVQKRCKGTTGAARKTITFDDYKSCLLYGKLQRRQMNLISSHLHEMFSETVNKIALSHQDDKRMISEDGINTFAHGHYKNW